MHRGETLGRRHTRRELGVALLDAGVEEGVNGEEAAGAGSVRGERALSAKTDER